MSRRFDGRRAIVTGAASGIGRATVGRLCDEGAEVLAIDLDERSLTEAFGTRDGVRPVAADVRDPSLTNVVESFGPTHVLVNAAGVLRRHELLDHPLDAWEFTLDVNLTAAMRLSRCVVRSWRAEGTAGAIVNVCSIESFTAAPDHVAYTVSKTGLFMFTRALALELAPTGIRVNGVAPGVTVTGMNQGLRDVPASAAALLRLIPMGRYGRPEEQAAAIAFLASDEASYVSGAVLPVDGAWTVQ